MSSDMSQPTPVDPEASRTGAVGAAVDPLVSPEPPGPDPHQQTPDQAPRGFRRRRTTLPRSTRGWSRGIVWSLIGLTTFGTIYGLIARIDSSISAVGRLRPVGGVMEVRVPFNALVEEVLVREGGRVVKGQPLLKLREAAVRQQLANVERMRSIWVKEVAITANQLGLPMALPRDDATSQELQDEVNELRLREAAASQERARSEINLRQQISDLESLRRRYALNDNISQRMESLIRQGAMARLELDRQNERQEELAATIRRTEEEVNSAQRRIEEIGFKQQQIPAAERKQLYAQYDNARQQLLEAEGRLMDLRDRLDLGRLRSPGAGQVFDLAVKAGEVATTAQPVMQIVPEKGLEAQLTVFNRDIGFVRTGLPVDVRVDSFPFTDYGALKGTVTRISADVKPPDALHPQPYFPVTIRLSQTKLSRNGKVYPLRPGMSVSSLINIGQRPVLSLIFDRIGSFFESTRGIR
jgi:HlyD family secretion protein